MTPDEVFAKAADLEANLPAYNSALPPYMTPAQPGELSSQLIDSYYSELISSASSDVNNASKAQAASRDARAMRFITDWVQPRPQENLYEAYLRALDRIF